MEGQERGRQRGSGGVSGRRAGGGGEGQREREEDGKGWEGCGERE